MKKMMLPVLAVSSLAVGCMSERHLPPNEESLVSQDEIGTVLEQQEGADVSSEFRPLVGQLPVHNGALEGSVGMVSGLAPESDYDTSGWGEPAFASVYTVGEGANGAAMTIVEIEGGLNHQELRPGAHLTYSIYDTQGGDSSLFAYVVGCAGPEANTWDFDQVADETTLHVSEHQSDPNVLVIDYEASFSDWETGSPSSVIGSFEVARVPN